MTTPAAGWRHCDWSLPASSRIDDLSDVASDSYSRFKSGLCLSESSSEMLSTFGPWRWAVDRSSGMSMTRPTS